MRRARFKPLSWLRSYQAARGGSVIDRLAEAIRKINADRAPEPGQP
jgi:hypothetical protein